MKLLFLFLATGGFFLGIKAAPAHALKMSPFKASIQAGIPLATQVYRLENNTEEPTAVQVSVLSWDINPDGSEVNRLAEETFSIFPAQIILKAHESRSVRIQWTGKTIPDVERAYRVLVEQIAIPLKDTPQQETGVKMMLRFKAALYITPEKAQSDIQVQSYTAGTNNDLVVDLVNMGSRHSLLRNAALELSLDDGQNIILSGESLKGIIGENIHAGRIRRFNLAGLPPLPSGIRDIKIHYDQGM